jgi:hypothetical protein
MFYILRPYCGRKRKRAFLRITNNWDDLKDDARNYYCVEKVLKGYPRPLAGTVNLGLDVAAKSYDQIREGIVRRLERALNRKIPITFAFSLGDNNRLHAHVALGALEDEPDDLIRETIARGAGGWDKPRGKQHQVHIQPMRDAGWATYMNQQMVHWSATNVLRTGAKELHRQHVRQNGKKSVPMVSELPPRTAKKPLRAKGYRASAPIKTKTGSYPFIAITT